MKLPARQHRVAGVGGPRPVTRKAANNPVNAPRTGRRSFTLNSTMESVSEVETAAEKLAGEAGLDPDTIPDPLAPENLLRGTGRGIFLIRSFMDEVHFRQLHPGTELTLIKHLAPAGDHT